MFLFNTNRKKTSVYILLLSLLTSSFYLLCWSQFNSIMISKKHHLLERWINGLALTTLWGITNRYKKMRRKYITLGRRKADSDTSYIYWSVLNVFKGYICVFTALEVAWKAAQWLIKLLFRNRDWWLPSHLSKRSSLRHQDSIQSD